MRVFYKHRGIANRFDGMTAGRRRAAGRTRRGHRLGRPRPGLLPRDRDDRGLPAASGRPAWCGCCTPSSSGSPTTSTSPSGWPTRPGSRWPPPGSRCTRNGCSGWSARCAAAGSAAAWWCPAGSPRCRCCRPRRSAPRQASSAGPITADADALMGTSSFLDRLRGTGPLTPARARQHGALGPIGEGVRVRRRRPARPPLRRLPVADPAARPRARRRRRAGPAAGPVGGGGPGVRPDPAGRRRSGRTDRRSRPAAVRARRRHGRSAGPRPRRARCSTTWSCADGRIARCQPRSASFHNLVLMHEVFTGDILTDFPFIEASFGLSVAGVAL